MDKYSHIIQRQILEVEITDLKYQREIQKKAQKILEEKLSEVLDVIFSKQVPDDVVITLDRIHIHISEINLDFLEENIVHQVQNILPTVIKEQIDLAIQDPLKKRIVPLHQAKLQAIKYYLLYGHFAWWMPSDHQKSLENIYIDIYQGDIKLFRELWMELCNEQIAIDRFLRQFNIDIIKKSIHLLSPRYGQYILDMLEDFYKIQPAILKVVQISEINNLKTNTKNIILSQFFKDFKDNKVFNESNFVEICLQKIAQDLDTNYTQLLSKLSQELLKKDSLFNALKSNLTTHIARLQDTYCDVTSIKTFPTPISSLIKQLDKILAKKDINTYQLSITIEEILQQSSNFISRKLLIDYIKSETSAQQLIQHLSEKDFIKIIQTIKPSTVPVFNFIKHIGQFVVLQEDKLVEKLTIQYLRISSSYLQEEPDKYLAYLVQEIATVDNNSEKLESYIKENKISLEKDYTNKLISTILIYLRESNKPKLKEPLNNISQKSVTDLLSQIIYETKKNIPATLLPSVIDLMNNLYKDLSILIQSQTNNKKELIKKVENNLRLFLQYNVVDSDKLSYITTKISSWLPVHLSEVSLYNSNTNGLYTLCQDLQAGLATLEYIETSQDKVDKKSAPITTELLKDFFTFHKLPAVLSTAITDLEYMKVVVKQIHAIPNYKKTVRDLLQQSVIRKNLVNNFSIASVKLLIDNLLPFSVKTKAVYENLFLKADVLRASTILEKEKILQEILLEAVNILPQMTEEKFLQNSLLSLSLHAQLPKSEVYRKLFTAAQKYTFPSSTIAKLQEIAPLFGTTLYSDITDKLDITFLPIYNLLVELLPTTTFPSNSYPKLLEFIKKVVQELPPLDLATTLQQQIATIFPTLSIPQSKRISKAIIKKIKTANSTKIQNIENAWKVFLKTGDIATKEYATPSSLFNKLISLQPYNYPSSAVNTKVNKNYNFTTSLHSQKNLREHLVENIQIAINRKRLLSSLPTSDIEKIIHYIASDINTSSLIIDWLYRIQSICETASSHTMPLQKSKLIWWEESLVALVNLPKENFSKKNWLANSLKQFSKALSLQPKNFINSVINRMKEEHSDQKFFIDELYETLTSIYKDQKEIETAVAKENWPTQPILQELDKLLKLGLQSLLDGTATKLEDIEIGLRTLASTQPSILKFFLYNHAEPATISKKIVHYFSTSTISKIIDCLQEKKSSFIQEFISFSTIPTTSYYSYYKIDSFSWRKYIEMATLTYLLENQESVLSFSEYIINILQAIHFYTKQPINLIIPSLLKHNKKSSFIKKYAVLINAIQTEIAIETYTLNSKVSAETSTALEENLNSIINEENKLQSEDITQQKFNKTKDSIELKLYIRNGGLIFLWPFLEELLEKQGLLEEQLLINNIDRNNALHTLQYLVTEELSTPEWRITLNKLLCGMRYDEVPFAGYYLRGKKDFADIFFKDQKKIIEATETSKQEKNISVQNIKTNNKQIPEEIQLLIKNTDEILRTVLEKWEDLRKLEKFEPYKNGFTIQDLREYILQRDSILQYIENGTKGYWHLTITWAEYDAELVKLPWSIHRIRLPFMKEDIVVFWLPT